VSRRSDKPAVSLFPFLDGLVCTMGALILLLLATTCRIRHQVEVKVLAEQQKMAAAAAQPDPEAERQALLRAQLEAQRKQEIAERIRAHEQALARHEADRNAKLAHWQTQINAMSERNSQLVSRVSQERQFVQSSAGMVAQLDREYQKLAALLSSASEHHQDVQQTEEQLRKQLEQLASDRKAIEQKVKAARNQHQSQEKPIFEVVAYDGNSRTERRPILIECRSDRLTFASEGISLSAATLDEFAPDRNPLLAGTEALLTYWTLVDAQKGKDKPGPYVLLIVRPGGTIGFYVARRYLEDLHREFGYELVSADAEIAWPPADPQAVEVCRTAVERALREERSAGNLAEGMSPGARGSGAARHGIYREDRVVGSNGEFILAEVERLKRGGTGESIDMLGSEWQRRGGGGTESAQRRPAGHQENRSGPTENGTGAAAGNGQPGTTQSAGDMAGKVPQPFPGLPEESGSRGENGQYRGNAARPIAMDDSGARDSGRRGNERNGQRGFPGNTDASGQSTRGSSGSRGQAGSQGSPQQGDQLPPSPFNREAALTNDGGVDRQWGRSRGGGAIGIERTVEVHLHLDKIRIVDGDTLPIPPNIDRPDFQESVAALIQRHAVTWGEAPSKFVWRPALHVFIHPGGNQHYPRIKQLAEHWGLSCKSEYVLDSR
jgi:hypothetical protein